ncbi:hypothetical protein Y1Q_0000017 [Alligator mississippiensis]|uniref:Uncharacterized protein n=1 Tax=Alligator mississippiensis TaxID=8496 RepID=A0A151NTG3_ALLMI|nr:hypothetical protein Y1Q_0000017 [Alligator mississippiensis]
MLPLYWMVDPAQFITVPVGQIAENCFLRSHAVLEHSHSEFPSVCRFPGFSPRSPDRLWVSGTWNVTQQSNG